MGKYLKYLGITIMVLFTVCAGLPPTDPQKSLGSGTLVLIGAAIYYAGKRADRRKKPG
jgi:hypothetical protein